MKPVLDLLEGGSPAVTSVVVDVQIRGENDCQRSEPKRSGQIKEEIKDRDSSGDGGCSRAKPDSAAELDGPVNPGIALEVGGVSQDANKQILSRDMYIQCTGYKQTDESNPV